MKILDLTLPSPQENLACDEGLLELCEQGYEHEIVRFWEPGEPFVVLGYSSRISSDVKLGACRRFRVPILRRCSGGGTVLQGRGCLNVSLILRLDGESSLRTITGTTRFILRRHKEALEPLIGRSIDVAGLSDLAIGGRKFSGNAQRRKRRGVLFHGTFLLDFDLPLVERLLAEPPRQPAYRRHRPHREFLLNLGIAAQPVKDALAAAWKANERLETAPLPQIERLTKTVYSSDAWTLRC